MSANIAKIANITRILVRFLIFAIFAIFVMGVFSQQKKSLLLLRFLRYQRTFRGPIGFFFFLSIDSQQICYFCDFRDICKWLFLHNFGSIISFATISKAICQQIFANKIDPGHKCKITKKTVLWLVLPDGICLISSGLPTSTGAFRFRAPSNALGFSKELA